MTPNEQLAEKTVALGIGTKAVFQQLKTPYLLPGKYGNYYSTADDFVADPRVMDAIMEKVVETADYITVGATGQYKQNEGKFYCSVEQEGRKGNTVAYGDSRIRTIIEACSEYLKNDT